MSKDLKRSCKSMQPYHSCGISIDSRRHHCYKLSISGIIVWFSIRCPGFRADGEMV